MAKSRTFRPLPLLGNPHVQTVVANLFSWTTDRYRAALRTFVLPDGDAMVGHDASPPMWRPGLPIALLVHGLGGCHRSSYLRRIANRLTGAGVRVVRLDLRGAGAGRALSRRFYNAACSQDIRAALAALHREAPSSPLLLFGLSLGANIVLKLAGEAGAEPVPGLTAVAAVAPPIDLVRCSELMSRQPFYDRYYVRQLIAQVSAHADHFPDLPRAVFPARITLREFDDIYTAPRWGFAGAMDYYRRASSLPLIPAIRVPTLIVTARDDPFIALSPFLEIAPLPDVTIEIAEQGGHLGFLGTDGQGGVRWAESRVVGWALRQVGSCQAVLGRS